MRASSLLICVVLACAVVGSVDAVATTASSEMSLLQRLIRAVSSSPVWTVPRFETVQEATHRRQNRSPLDTSAGAFLASDRRRQVEKQELNISTFESFAQKFFEQEKKDGNMYLSVVLSAVDANSNLTYKEFFGSESSKLNDDTRFQIASISKTFTAVACMQLVEQGKLSLDEDINKYLPRTVQIPDTVNIENGGIKKDDPVTLRQLMTHVAGFEELITGQLRASPRDLEGLEEFLAKAMPARINPSNTVPAYSNYAWSLVGLIVQEQSGKPYWQYVRDHIFTPLGMSKSFVCCFEGQDYEADVKELAPFGTYAGKNQQPGPGLENYFQLFPAGAIWSTGADMIKFAQMLLRNGTAPGVGQPILSAQSVSQMTTSHWGGPIGTGFGVYHYYLNDATAVLHDGDMPGFSSRLLLLPEQGFAFFLSVSSGGAPARENLVEDMAEAFFEPRAPRTDFLPENPSRASKDSVAGAYLNTRANFRGCTKLYSVISSASSPPFSFSAEDASISVSLVSGIDAVYGAIPGDMWGFKDLEISPSLKLTKNLTFTFEQYPFLLLGESFETKNRIDYATVLASVNGQMRVPNPGFSAAWVITSLVLLLVGLCCCSCCWCISCCVRRKHPFEGPEISPLLPQEGDGQMRVVPKSAGKMCSFGPQPLQKIFNNRRTTSYMSMTVATLLVVFNLLTPLAFLGAANSVVFGNLGWPYFLLTLPILSIILYILGFPLAVFAFVYGHWYFERRVIFVIICSCGFLLTFWYANLNLLGYHCYE